LGVFLVAAIVVFVVLIVLVLISCFVVLFILVVAVVTVVLIGVTVVSIGIFVLMIVVAEKPPARVPKTTTNTSPHKDIKTVRTMSNNKTVYNSRQPRLAGHYL